MPCAQAGKLGVRGAGQRGREAAAPHEPSTHPTHARRRPPPPASPPPADPAAQDQYNRAAVQVAFLAGVLYTAIGLLRMGWVRGGGWVGGWVYVCVCVLWVGGGPCGAGWSGVGAGVRLGAATSLPPSLASPPSRPHAHLPTRQVTNFLSHAVVSGFMTGASITIALSQVGVCGGVQLG